MKLLLGAVVYNLLAIIIFSLIYYYYAKNLNEIWQREHGYQKITYLDVLFFATTVQSGVGLSSIVVQSDFMKCIVILQQVLMISSYIFLIYFFHLK
jgi:hypothetical protein